jgi:hypothetical protein
MWHVTATTVTITTAQAAATTATLFSCAPVPYHTVNNRHINLT